MSVEDQAQELELFYWELANQPRGEVKKYQPHDPGYGPEFCVIEHCGDLMPEARRAWGFKICVQCKERQERSGNRRHFKQGDA